MNTYLWRVNCVQPMNCAQIKGTHRKRRFARRLKNRRESLTHFVYLLVARLMMAGGDLNVRKSLKNQFSSNGTAVGSGGGGATTNGIPRKTLMHKMSEDAMELNDSKEMVGLQNSQFNLKQIEANFARLGRIHLILEHLITIKTDLNLENGELNLRLVFVKIQHLPSFFAVFTSFLDDLHKPLIPFKVLKDMQSDFRAIPVSNTKILAKIGK